MYRRMKVGLVLQAAAALCVGGFTQYQMSGQCLGLRVLSLSNLANIIALLEPHVKGMLDEEIALAIANMASMDQTLIGSNSRAETMADRCRCWLTRGAFSKNATVHVRNYCTNEVIACHHVCQRVGQKDNADGYQGISKSAEGYGAVCCFEELKAKGIHIAIHRQDGDSSSEKSFLGSYPNAEQSVLMYCSGHVGRQRKKQLEKLSKQKTIFGKIPFTPQPLVTQAELRCTCVCMHRKGCSIPSNAFISKAVLNHSATLVQWNRSQHLQAMSEHHPTVDRSNRHCLTKVDSGEDCPGRS